MSDQPRGPGDIIRTLTVAIEIERKVESAYLELESERKTYPRSIRLLVEAASAAFPSRFIKVTEFSPTGGSTDVDALLLRRNAAGRNLPEHIELEIEISVNKLVDPPTQRFSICRELFLALIEDGMPRDEDTLDVIKGYFNTYRRSAFLQEGVRDVLAVTAHDILADVAAAEFLFPYRERLKTVQGELAPQSIQALVKKFGIPASILRYYASERMVELFRGMPLVEPN